MPKAWPPISGSEMYCDLRPLNVHMCKCFALYGSVRNDKFSPKKFKKIERVEAPVFNSHKIKSILIHNIKYKLIKQATC